MTATTGHDSRAAMPGTLSVGRPARTVPPAPAASVLDLAAPPRQAESPAMSGSMGMILVPTASGVGAVLLAVTHRDRPLMAAAGLLVLAASIAVGLAMLIGSRTGARRRTREQRERYLDYLEQVRSGLRRAVGRQLSAYALLHPDPAAAAGMAFLPARRWERRPTDPDFLLLRVGVGVADRVLTARVRVDADDPLVAYEPVCLAAAQELADCCSPLQAQPRCLPFDGGAATCVIGTPERAAGLARAVLAQLVWAHSPAEAGVLVCVGAQPESWDWVKWLPHAQSVRERDGTLPLRLVADTEQQARELLAAEAAPAGSGTRRYLIVIDRRAGPRITPQEEAAWTAAATFGGAHLLYLVCSVAEQPELVATRLIMSTGPDGGGADVMETCTPALDGANHPRDGPPPAASDNACHFDELDELGAMTLARSFAPLRPVAEPAPQAATADGPPEHSPLGDAAAIDPARSWRPRRPDDLLRAPIGLGADGSAVLLDLKESAAGGMGPHGLIVGATGSGKSELLRTLVIALAVRHPPEDVAFLLVDFKGGATFSGLSALPHLAGKVTNLEGELGVVDRFRDALGGELRRRQELLAAAGGLTSLSAYRELRRHRARLEAVPHLLVIVDEFSELLGARPDLAELFVTIGRIGRSIGIHLLLATQRLDTGRIRGLESHLSFRICLRTFSEAESREAIGSPDAHHLPSEPGWAYLLGDGPEPRRFRAATVSIPARSPRARRAPVAMVLPFVARNGVGERAVELQQRGRKPSPFGGPAHRAARPSQLDVAVDRLVTGAHSLPAGRSARRIWLDPLPAHLTLADHLGDRPAQHREPTGVIATLGLTDRPESQRQDPLEWDFAAGNANLLIVGAGRSGKSTALQTLIAALCLRHAPGEVELLCVDHGGQNLLPWAGLPHVAAVGSRTEPELTSRIFTRLTEVLAERELVFRRHRFASTADLRRARRDGTVDPAIAGDVLLIIDGWASVRDTHEDLESLLGDILVRGPGLGVHTVLTVPAPHQLRSRLAGAFGGRVELRLADSFDSAFDRSMAKALPPRLPGRALIAGPHVAQLAQPILAADTANPNTAAGGIEHTIAVIRERWPGPGVRSIRTLPHRVTLTELRQSDDIDHARRRRPGELLLGLAEDGMRPIRWDPGADDPHLVIIGGTRTGKTTLLRSLRQQLTETDPKHGPDHSGGPGPGGGFRPEVHIIDYRRHLLGTTWQLSSATAAPRAAELCSALARELMDRNSSDPPTFVMVDDYDLVATAEGNPLQPLLPLLPRSRDLGLHLVLTRRVGGAARAMYEPVLQSLVELGAPIMLFSGPATEGRIAHGIAPAALPPGRARLATRDGPPHLIQVPIVEPPDTEPAAGRR